MNQEQTIAHDLLSIGAVFLRPDEPFTWASGIKSPIYCDNRLTLTAPAVRTHVEEGLVDEIFSAPVHPYTRSLIALANVKYKNKDEDLAQLGGFVPVAGRESRSCAFASRCRYERADCMAAVEYRRLSDTHYVRCWR